MRLRLPPRPLRRKIYISLALACAVLLAVWLTHLDLTVRERFEGERWALPAHVYARPLELYQGLSISPGRLTEELAGLGYREMPALTSPGSYLRRNNSFEIYIRGFHYSDGDQPSRIVRLGLDGAGVVSLATTDGSEVGIARLEPALVGSVYPVLHEDRVPVKLDQVPVNLVAALIAVEDHEFFSHHGIAPRSIARALIANLRAGQAVQGGSTLTQQLVKNFYLTADRSLRRKLVEACMAIMLEWHYGKEEILEAYINEIYLGQQGNRAIHGFGLASQFYFGRPLQELRLSEIALMVGMIRGPSYYNPRRNPQRALERRNLVLAQMSQQGFITAREYRDAQAEPAGVTARPLAQGGGLRAFLDLVHRQLRRDYLDEDLRSEGLRIFTSLDLVVQGAAEKAVAELLPRLELERRLPARSLEAAVIVTNTADGEILAVVGGRDTGPGGFNRALDAQRPAGSLIKPAVYLAALEQPDRYSLASLLDDGPLVYQTAGAADWTPANYDKRFHGRVPMYEALAQSYNVATARLGLELGMGVVVDTLRRLGISREIPPYPSTILGAVSLTPLEVTQMYHSVAANGFRSPLRTVRAVLTPDGVPLTRYGLDLEQVADPAPVYLLTRALQRVVSEGTAKGLKSLLPADLNVAGKTGTTDDFRDSWFAGFTGDRLAVTWVGRDDNQPTGMSGAAGAMRIWGAMMGQVASRPLVLSPPAEVIELAVDPASGLRAGPGCPGTVQLPFIAGSEPAGSAPCGGSVPAESAPADNFFRRLFRRLRD